MIKEFRNNLDEKITEEEALARGDYRTFYFDKSTNALKRRDRYYKGAIRSISYYISKNEDKQEILHQLLQVSPKVGIIYTNNLRELRLEHYHEYDSDGQLIFNYDVLYNTDDRAICYEQFDLLTNEPDYKKTKKYYYNDEGDTILEGTYNNDGSLDRIVLMLPTDNDQNWEYYFPSNLHELKREFKEDMSYYHTAKLEPGDMG